MNQPAPAASSRAPKIPQENIKILRDCRDLATHRLVLSFTAMLDRVSDLLLGRAQRATNPNETTVYLTARDLIGHNRAQLVSEFEQTLRRRIDERIGGRGQIKRTFANVEVSELKLIDDTEMEESVIVSNISRVFDNMCESEILPLNRRLGHLLNDSDMETVDNPFAPHSVFSSFKDSWKATGAADEIKLAVMRELNATVLGDVKSIYADLNRHLVGLAVLPHLRPTQVRKAGRRAGDPKGDGSAEEVGADLMGTLQKVLTKTGGKGFSIPASKVAGIASAGPFGQPGGMPGGMAGGMAGGGVGGSEDGSGGGARGGAGHGGGAGGMSSGEMLGNLFSGAPGGPGFAIDTPVISALTRLQQGDTGFDFGDGTIIQVATNSGPTKHNFLRDIQESPLGERMNQIDSMTIELVAMLFDFIFVDKDVPDGIKALIGRLQIPVLKAAMLDRAFFSKKTHPARILVNRLAQAGIGWLPETGIEDPLYKKIESIVERVINDFTDDLGLFSRLHDELEQYLGEEEKQADTVSQASVEEVTRQDQVELARLAASAEVERRLLLPLVPAFIGDLLRKHWTGELERVHLAHGEGSEPWTAELSILDELVWSVQPKRSPEERRRLTSTLPKLLKSLKPIFDRFTWAPDERETLIGHLVEAHTSAVKASATAPISMEVSQPLPPRQMSEVPVYQDEYSELAAQMARGMWIEFEDEGAKLTFAKLAWISPLRGTLLFTNRQGQQAFSLTPFELADRFRNDRARPVDAEPLVDRAFSSMLASLSEQIDEEAAVPA